VSLSRTAVVILASPNPAAHLAKARWVVIINLLACSFGLASKWNRKDPPL
jgi:hypothetical protein